MRSVGRPSVWSHNLVPRPPHRHFTKLVVRKASPSPIALDGARTRLTTNQGGIFSTCSSVEQPLEFCEINQVDIVIAISVAALKMITAAGSARFG